MMEQPVKEAYAAPESVANIMRDVTQVLKYYNLNPTQIRAYLYLAKAGPTTPTELSRKIGVHRTGCYKAAKDLEALGLVAQSVNRPATFSALSFREAVTLLGQERKHTMDSMQLMGGVLAAAFERIPSRRRREKRSPQMFTKRLGSRRGTFNARIEELDGVSRRRLAYLQQPAFARFAYLLEEPARLNDAAPELGSFIVYDDRVLLFFREDIGVWAFLEISVPEVVAAYARLYAQLEAEA